MGATQQGAGDTQTFVSPVQEGGLEYLIWLLEPVGPCGYLRGVGRVAFNL